MHNDPHDDRRQREQSKYIIIVGEDKALERTGAAEVDETAEQRELGIGDADAVGAAGHPEELEGKAPQHLRQRQCQDAEEDARVPYAHEPEQRGDEQRAQEPADDAELHGLRAEVAYDERNRIGKKKKKKKNKKKKKKKKKKNKKKKNKQNKTTK